MPRITAADINRLSRLTRAFSVRSFINPPTELDAREQCLLQQGLPRSQNWPLSSFQLVLACARYGMGRPSPPNEMEITHGTVWWQTPWRSFDLGAVASSIG